MLQYKASRYYGAENKALEFFSLSLLRVAISCDWNIFLKTVVIVSKN